MFKFISPLDCEPLLPIFETEQEAKDYLDALSEPEEDRNEYQIVEVEEWPKGC